MALNDVERIVREVAGKYNFRDPDLLVATVHQESAFNPRAVGDSGNSRGIFQENIRGRGAGLTPEQSFDPYGSTERAIREFQAFDRPGQTPGQWAARAQRPANPVAYANAIDAWLGAGNAGTADRTVSRDEPSWYTEWMASRRAPTSTTKPVQPAPAADEGAPSWYREWLAAGSPGAGSAPREGEGGFVWPVAGQRPGAVTNPFGARQSRSAGTTIPLPATNNGADLAGRYGDTVVAPVSGTVLSVYDARAERDPNENSGWGGMTLLRGDDGYNYRLSHARPGSVAARPGQRVTAGQPLQEIGVSGNSTGPHLDLEKFDNSGRFVDPTRGAGGPPSPSGGARGVDPARLTTGPGDPAWYLEWVNGLRRGT